MSTGLPAILIDEGENFRLCVWRKVAYCQVWRRPDVTAAEGTRYAAVLMNSLRQLLTDAKHPVPGIVIDVRQAPPVSGPNTMALLAEAVTTWSLAGKNVVMLVGPKEQRAQMDELLAAHGNGRGMIRDDVDAALKVAAAPR